MKDMICLKYDLNDERVQYLIRTDEMLGKLIRYIGTSELAIEKDGFKCLVKYIVGQQISDKARETIWQRICTTFGNVTPDIMLSTNDSDLRGVGLSGSKVEYIKTLAGSIIEKRIYFEEFQTLSNKDIITKLTALKGIGQWTAEMYLIFSLGRENVLSKGDGTIKRTIQWMYDLKELPSSKVLTEHFVNWNEYATIVSTYLWKSIALGLTQKSFDEAIPG
ncbi:MAG TPA: DNA-3-methyladenine glycosylase 2 family protein [Clostridium sp.]|nr:DNA-3-methyladenine glycosylase 2 family protein [Clostridium sp.]